MQRDMDLVRQILLEVEQKIGALDAKEIEIEGAEPNTVNYHVGLLVDAGLLRAENVTSMGRLEYLVQGLTWEGHEFLDASRNSQIWEKAKAVWTEKSLTLPFEVMKVFLAQLIKESLFGG